MTVHPGLDRLKTRIQGLCSKTTDNGCTEAEALLAATKVAELLDRYDLSLTDVEIRNSPCEEREYQTDRKKRIPLDDCVGAVANFCDCQCGVRRARLARLCTYSSVSVSISKSRII